MNSLSKAVFTRWLERVAAVTQEQRAHLTQLDSAVGDGDHGENLARGFGAVLAKLPGWQEADIGATCKGVAMTLISTVGGASGPLYGSFFLEVAKAAAGKQELSLAEWTEAFAAGVNGVVARGKAVPGDKTMVDALTPALAALRGSPELLPALRAAAAAAGEAARATEPLVARKGRASYLGERSAGHRDPGAESSRLILEALAEAAAG